MVRIVVDSIPDTRVAPAVREGRVAPERQHDEPAPHNQTDSERQVLKIAPTTMGR
jgi:hypothetical protein